MSTSIFISRPLSDTNALHLLNKKYEIEWTDISLLEFSPVSYELPYTSYLFFYSKKGVDFFFKKKPKGEFKVYTYGAKTARHCEQYCEVINHFNTDQQAAINYFSDEKKCSDVTFVCGQSSLRAVHQHLIAQEAKECIVYKVDPIEQSLEHYDVALLTSPLNVTSFFKNGGIAKHYIAIGQTTAQALQQESATCHISEHPSESSMLSKLSEVLLKIRS